MIVLLECLTFTEASKLVMNYVTKVSTNYKGVERVKEQLLQSNPVLEGNSFLKC